MEEQLIHNQQIGGSIPPVSVKPDVKATEVKHIKCYKSHLLGFHSESPRTRDPCNTPEVVPLFRSVGQVVKTLPFHGGNGEFKSPTDHHQSPLTGQKAERCLPFGSSREDKLPN